MPIRLLSMALFLVLVGSNPSWSETPSAIQYGLYYFPGWYRNEGKKFELQDGRMLKDWSEWRGAIMQAAEPRPLLGFYDDSAPAYWSHAIRWMHSHGVNFLAFDWYYNNGQEYLEASLDKGFLGNPANTQIDYCIHWCNHGGYWWREPLNQGRDALEKMLILLHEKHFHRSNYLRYQDCPVLMIYDTQELLRAGGGEEQVRKSLAGLRASARSLGYKDLYLVAVYSGWSPTYPKFLKELGFDAFTAYTYMGFRPPDIRWDSRSYPYRSLVDYLEKSLYQFMAKAGKQADMVYWPTTFTGWDDRPRAGVERGIVLTENTPNQFERMLQAASQSVHPDFPVVMIEAWNEWGEGAHMEPARKYGFGYLDALAKVSGNSKSKDQTLPSKDEILSFSVLTPEELVEAQKNEALPWAVQSPIFQEMGESQEVPAVDLPLVFDFSHGNHRDKLRLSNLQFLSDTPEGILFQSTSQDPTLYLDDLSVPMKQISRIVLKGHFVKDNQPISPMEIIELHWLTGLLPTARPFASAQFPPLRDSQSILETSQLYSWQESGTPLKSLRIDPGQTPGLTFLLKQIRIE